MLQQVTLLLSKNHLSPVKYRNSIYFNKKATMRSLNNNHVLSQSSVQVQRVVQHKPAFVQEHLLRHPFLHPHLTSSWHDFVTSGNVVQNGFQMPSPIVHPHSCGLGNTGLGTSACPQQCPAWYAARLACSTRAALVGGMASRALPFWANSCFLASLTDVLLLVRSYINTTKRSRCSTHLLLTSKGLWANARNAPVTSR